VIEAKGYGVRIRELVAERASQIVRATQSVRRYTDTQFAADVGLAERGKPYPLSTLGDWLSERNELRFATCLAMEVVLERPGAAVYIAFGCWPSVDGEGKIPATPGAVKSPHRPKGQLDLDPTRDRRATDDELARARRLVAAKTESKRLLKRKAAGRRKRD
jgi:hypothetical protein